LTLFADISGYSKLTDALARSLGAWRGAEEVTRQINLVYDALIAVVEAHGGSVISFSGDAITCWFAAPGPAAPNAFVDRSTAIAAVACGLALQHAMRAFASVPLPDGSTAAITLKVAIAYGPARRMVVGDPHIQLLDALAGETVIRAAEIEHLADPGDVLIDAALVAALGADLKVAAWRTSLDGMQAALIAALRVMPALHPPGASVPLPEALVRPWLHPDVYECLHAWPLAFFTELRPAVSLFVRFGTLDFTAAAAGRQLDAYIRYAQHVLADNGGLLTQLTFGDKGSYFLATFGVPVAHEDDSYRALAAALSLRRPPAATGIDQVQIGVSRGLVRVGTYGGASRRIYGTMGNEVNLAARLMMLAAPGQILVDAGLYNRVAQAFSAEPLAPLTVRGYSRPVAVVALGEQRTTPALAIRSTADSAPLVGRIHELHEAEERLTLARQGRGQVICLVGEAGLGKSRLAAEIRRRAKRAGLRCLLGGAQPYGLNAPYLAWRAIGRDFFAVDGAASLAEQAARLEQMLTTLTPDSAERLPLLGTVLGLSLAETELTRGMSAQLRKEALHHTLVECLRAGAAAEPLLLIVEDAHWLDPLSLDLIAELAVALADAPIALLITTRPDDERWRTALPDDEADHCAVITLTELADADAEQLVVTKLQAFFGPQVQVPPELITRLNAWSQGNPFYLEEVLYYLRDRRATADLQAISAIELPSSLAGLILSRIDQLPAAQQRLLKVASITGITFAVEWLRGVYPAIGPAEQVQRDLTALARLGITPATVVQAQRRHQFRHSLMHEVIYESVPFEVRTELHEQFADWLETQPDAPPLELIAFHYGRSANTPKQREYFRRAADAAARSYANDTARHYYERLLELLPAAERADVLLALGNVLDRFGAWEAAHDRLHEAAALAGDQPALLAAIRSQLATIERSLGRYDEAMALLAQVRTMYETLDDRRGWVRASNELGTNLRLRGDYAAARAVLIASLASAEQIGDRSGMARALHILGNVSGSIGDLALSIDEHRRGLALYRELGDPHGIAVLCVNLGLAAYEQGDYDHAEEQIEEGLALFRQIGGRRDTALALMNQARVVLARGDALRARRMFTECLSAFHTIGARWEQTMALVWVATALIAEDPAPERMATALTLATAALRLLASIGAAFEAVDHDQAERLLARTRAALSPEQAAAAETTGRTYSWAEATAYALAER
jgi:class 3 adenylate cyclase/tetratricopeptide (TPR) repeat protein